MVFFLSKDDSFVEPDFNPYPYGPIANLFPMGGGRHVSPSYDVF